jgi:integrase
MSEKRGRTWRPSGLTELVREAACSKPARRSISTSNVSVTKTDILETIDGTLKTSVISAEAGGQDHPVFLWLASLGPTSRRSMLSALARGTRLLGQAGIDPLQVDWSGFGHQQMLQVRVALESTGSVCSRNLTLTALRGVMRMAWQVGLVTLEQYERVRSVRNFRQFGDVGTGRAVTRAERTRLLALADVHPRIACRDRALIGLMLAAGLRRSEAATLARASVDLAEGCLLISGKGGRVRRLPISAAVAPALHMWLRQLPKGGRFVFPRVSRSGRVLEDAPISGAAIALLLRRRCAACGIARIRPHDCRRTTATDALEAGCDLLAVQGILGHSTPAVTARYDKRGFHSRRAVTESVFLPNLVVGTDNGAQQTSCD